jgi:hypothetical protein
MHRYLSRALMNARVSGMHGKAANRRKRSDQPYSDGPAGIGQEAMPIIRIFPATRLFLEGNTASMLGTGLVVAFTLIYLHQVRGIARWSSRSPASCSTGLALAAYSPGSWSARPPLRSCWRGRTTRLRPCRLAAIRRDLVADVPGTADHDCRP